MAGAAQTSLSIGPRVERHLLPLHVLCLWVRIGEGRGSSGSVPILHGDPQGTRTGLVILALTVFLSDDQNNDHDASGDDESKDDDTNRNVNILIVCFRFLISNSGIINGHLNIKLGTC